MKDTTTTPAPAVTISPKGLGIFHRAYLEAALWTNKEQLESDSPDLDIDIDNISVSTEQSSMNDCRDFLTKAQASKYLNSDDIDDMSLAGHEFWLTRAGEGSGFWDSVLAHGDELTTLSKTYCHLDVVPGNDDLIYFV